MCLGSREIRAVWAELQRRANESVLVEAWSRDQVGARSAILTSFTLSKFSTDRSLSRRATLRGNKVCSCGSSILFHNYTKKGAPYADDKTHSGGEYTANAIPILSKSDYQHSTTPSFIICDAMILWCFCAAYLAHTGRPMCIIRLEKLITM